MKLKTLLKVLLVTFPFACCELHFSIWKLECIDEDDTIYAKNMTCYIKTVSRGLNVMTSLSDFTQSLHIINANLQVLQKSPSNLYDSVILNNSFEVCHAMGKDAAPLVKFIVPLISRFAPKFIHPCPYQGKNIGVENLPIDFSLLPLVQLSNFPKGDYRADMTFYDKDWQYIHWIKLYGTIRPKRFNKKHSGPSNSKQTGNEASD